MQLTQKRTLTKSYDNGEVVEVAFKAKVGNRTFTVTASVEDEDGEEVLNYDQVKGDRGTGSVGVLGQRRLLELSTLYSLCEQWAEDEGYHPKFPSIEVK